jgi:DNA-binding XRE family transcriptional regulator
MTVRIGTRARGRNHTLITLRVNAGLSPNELGAECGVSGKTIRDAEEGRITPLPRTQFQIARAFGKDPTDIWPIGGRR